MIFKKIEKDAKMLLNINNDNIVKSFIITVNKGVAWTITHNGIEYVTSVMVNSYPNRDSNFFRVGVMDIIKPTKEFTFRELLSVKEQTETSNEIAKFIVTLKTDTPEPMEVVLKPIKYYSLNGETIQIANQ